MSDHHEFFFALHLPDDDGFASVLGDLTTSVLRHAGYAAGVIAQVGDQLRAGVTKSRTTGECDVQYRAHAGELEIVVSQGGRRIVHITRRLP